MDFLKIDQDKLIELLLNDGRIEIVREAVVSDGISNLVKLVRLEYCTKDEIAKILESESTLLSVMGEYNLSEEIIDMIICDHLEYTKAIKIIIDEYISTLMPGHFERLIKNIKFRSWITDRQDCINDESSVFMYKNNLLPLLSPRQSAAVVCDSMLNVEIWDLSMDEIGVQTFMRKFSEEELLFVIEKVLSSDCDLRRKGYIDVLMQTQDMPLDVIYKVVTEWTYTLDESWFQKMLQFQDLSSVFDYLLENFKLNTNSIKSLMKNTKTSTSLLIKLYEDYSELIVELNPCRIPVLDCHTHMC